MMTDYMALASQLRSNRAAEQQARTFQGQQGGAATSNGGMIGGGGSMVQSGGFQPMRQNNQQMGSTSSPLSSAMDMATKYNQFSNGGLNRMVGMGGTGGATGAAGAAAMPAMAAGGGSSLGSMGLMSSAAPVSFPGAVAGGGSATAGGSAAGGAMGAAGGLAGLAALSYLGDKEMNENKGSMINADKLNDAGSIGNSGIGLRFGDFANGFNPATWMSDPKKAGKGLVNAFTFGLGDKFFDLF